MNDRKPFEWINEESITFLQRGYLSEGEEPLERIRTIAEHAENLLGIEGFADKFYDYMGKVGTHYHHLYGQTSVRREVYQ